MKDFAIGSLCALATVALGWGWPWLTQNVRPAPAPAVAASTEASSSPVGAQTPPSSFADRAVADRHSGAAILAAASADAHSAPSEIAGTLPVAGLIGLLAFGGAVALQLARRRA